ncbi:MAG: hypothetical protein HY331_16555 [Chloroflexi bacterium]|nr:hypothetical protein [Chloroflexota bacterium]
MAAFPGARESESVWAVAPSWWTVRTSVIPFQTIFFLYIPLAASNLMMSVSNPIINAFLARLPEPEVSLAAFGLVWSLGVLIESPIIMILSTSVALVKDRRSYVVALRFTTGLALILSALSAAVYFSPLYDRLVLDLMSIPENVARAAQPAVQIMSFWTPAIGLRRLYQGILIRNRFNRLIAFGTVVRLVVQVLGLVAGALWTDLSAPIIGALTQIASATAEAVVVMWWARGVVVNEVLPREPEGAPLTYGRLVAFHWPLAATSAMRVLIQPIIAAGLARMADPQMTLAAWPVALGTVMLLNSFTMSIQELTIALVKDEASGRSVRRFTRTIGLALGVILTAVAFTPLVDLFLTHIMGVGPAVHDYAAAAIRWLVVLPTLMAHLSLFRGLMTVRWQTSAVRTGMVVHLLTLVGTLTAGVLVGQAPALMVAGLSTIAATTTETGYLVWKSRQWTPSPTIAPATAEP